MSDAPLAVGRPVAAGGEPGQATAAGQAGGRTVEAFVVGHDRSGAPILQSAEGRIAFTPGTPLDVGTRLTLLIRPDGSIRTLTSEPASTRQEAGASAVVRLGTASALSGQASQLPPGSILHAEVLHRTAPTAGASPPRPGEIQAGLRVGELLVLRIQSALSPSGSEIAASRIPPDFLARVASGGAQLSLSTSLGTLQLAGSESADPLGRLTLRLIGPSAANPAASSALMPETAGNPLVLAKAWPALRKTLDQAAVSDPAVAAALRSELPKPGEGFIGQVLRFIFVMNFEDPADQALSRLFPQLAAHAEGAGLKDGLADDVQRYGRWAETGNEWRTFVVPVADGERLTPFHFYLRDRQAHREADPSEAGVRFMVDVDLSRLGAIQLDGLYRRRHLSLTVRSPRRFPRGFGDPLREIFDRALLGAGMSGELRIESDAALSREPLGSVLEGFPQVRA